MTSSIERRLRQHPDNARILSYLRVGETDPLRPWTHCAFDEGGVALFERFGAALPSECKYGLGIHNVMVHPLSGRIFTVHTGRYTFLLRRGTTSAPERRVVETLDGEIDLRAVEDAWCVFHFEDEEDCEELGRAYERAADST